MVGAGEQKTGSAGNGVVFADYQTVVVDGILVQHVVPPEQGGRLQNRYIWYSRRL